jgi:triacylglycerol lipase
MGQKLEQWIAVLNGAVGDHLAKSNNGLATEMSVVHAGQAISVANLCAQLKSPSERVVLFVHGLMSTEAVWQFQGGGDYGSRLVEDLGVSAIHVRYNSGRAIPDNGEEFARLLTELIQHYPRTVKDISLIGYSMGGLVIRSACQYANASTSDDVHAALALVQRAIYVGTPHRGAPMERAGRIVARILEATGDPYARLFADIANARSRGVKDLARGAQEWNHPVPLLASMKHFLAAGTLLGDSSVATWFGDAVVPLSSATDGQHAHRHLHLHRHMHPNDAPPERPATKHALASALPAHHVRVFPNVNHIEIARNEQVYTQLRTWMNEP